MSTPDPVLSSAGSPIFSDDTASASSKGAIISNPSMRPSQKPAMRAASREHPARLLPAGDRHPARRGALEPREVRRMKALVLGGSGYIGAAVAQRLEAKAPQL